jgi:hypothetical protein
MKPELVLKYGVAVLSLLVGVAVAENAQVKPAVEPSSPAPASAVAAVPPVKILSRAEWNAKAPVGKMVTHEPKFITVHHTAVKQNPKKSLKEKLKALQEFSQRESTLGNGKQKPVWPDVPYHFYISENGDVGEGRGVDFVGDTNTAYDPAGHILVTLEGNFEEEEPTAAQLKSADLLVVWLAQKYQVPAANIKGHKDYAQTACPGEKLYQRLGTLQEAVKKASSP